MAVSPLQRFVVGGRKAMSERRQRRMVGSKRWAGPLTNNRYYRGVGFLK